MFFLLEAETIKPFFSKDMESEKIINLCGFQFPKHIDSSALKKHTEHWKTLDVPPFWPLFITHIGSMYGIYLYIWLNFYGNCRHIYHTWIRTALGKCFRGKFVVKHPGFIFPTDLLHGLRTSSRTTRTNRAPNFDADQVRCDGDGVDGDTNETPRMVVCMIDML